MDYEDDAEDGPGKVVWNIDDQENMLLFKLKLSVVEAMQLWDLEKEYWALLILLTEAESLFDDDTKEELREEFKKISKFRISYNEGAESDDTKAEYFMKLNELYRNICEQIVEKGLYFRKKKQYIGL